MWYPFKKKPNPLDDPEIRERYEQIWEILGSFFEHKNHWMWGVPIDELTLFFSSIDDYPEAKSKLANTMVDVGFLHTTLYNIKKPDRVPSIGDIERRYFLTELGYEMLKGEKLQQHGELSLVEDTLGTLSLVDHTKGK